jgi:hypothetical protein
MPWLATAYNLSRCRFGWEREGSSPTRSYAMWHRERLHQGVVGG